MVLLLKTFTEETSIIRNIDFDLEWKMFGEQIVIHEGVEQNILQLPLQSIQVRGRNRLWVCSRRARIEKGLYGVVVLIFELNTDLVSFAIH